MINSSLWHTWWGVIVADQESMERYAEEERQIRQENVRLQRKLQMEIERREQMCRRLSESESSIEMDEERFLVISLWCELGIVRLSLV